MKSIFILSLVLLLAALPLNASEYSFDIELDDQGNYSDSSDLGMELLVVEAQISESAQSLTITAPNGDQVVANDVKANVPFAVGIRAKRLSLEIVGCAAKGQTIKATLEWKFAKSASIFTAAMKTNGKGKATYKTSIESGELSAHQFIASHNCTVAIEADGQKVFNEAVKIGKPYVINARFAKSIKCKVTEAPKNKKVYLDMQVSGGAVVQEAAVSAVEALMGVQGSNQVRFSATTDETGCIHTDPYEVDTQGVAPEIRLIMVNQYFDNLTVKLNGITFHPEYLAQFKDVYIYQIGVSFKNDKLNVGLEADGGKPECDTNVTVYYNSQDTNE